MIFSYLLFASCSSAYDTVRNEAYAVAAPKGMVWLRDSLYISKTELSVYEYKQYLHWLEIHFGKNSTEYLIAYPHTEYLPSNFVYTDTSGAIIDTNYFEAPYMLYYPVTNLDFEQVLQYCKWKTFHSNEQLYYSHFTDTQKQDSVKEYPLAFIYRLPTWEEWKYAASAGLDTTIYPFGYEKLSGRHKTSSFNCNINLATNKPRGLNFYPSGVYSYKPNKYGIRNIIGNVAEMTSSRGIIKGGGFFSPPDSCKINSTWYTSGSEAGYWIGCRLVAEKLHSDALISDIYHTEEHDDLKINIDSLKECYFIYCDVVHQLQKFSDVAELNSSDKLYSFECIVAPGRGSVSSDVMEGDQFSDFTLERIQHISTQSWIVFQNIQVIRNGEIIMLDKSICIRTIR